jgi:hypothetical protein
MLYIRALRTQLSARSAGSGGGGCSSSSGLEAEAAATQGTIFAHMSAARKAYQQLAMSAARKARYSLKHISS